MVHVVDRESGTFTTSTAPPFFFFHIAGSFDSEDGDFVNIDIAGAYEDPEIVAALYLDRVGKKGGPDLPISRLTRLKVPVGGSKASLTPLDDTSASGGFCDFPAVNKGNYKRFVWTIGAKKPTTVANRIVKTDIEERSSIYFDVPSGAIPGEPVFVGRPEGTKEDDGILLVMVNMEEVRKSEDWSEATAKTLCRPSIELGWSEATAAQRSETTI